MRKAEIKARKRQEQRAGKEEKSGIQALINPFEALDGAAEEEADGKLIFYNLVYAMTL